MNFRNVWEDTADIGISASKGLLSGTESALNGATLGGYRWLGDKVGLGVSQRAEELQQQADAAGVGGLNQVGNFFAEMGGSLRGLSNLGYNAIRKGISILAPQMSKSVVAPSILSGTAESGVNSMFENDFLNWQEVGKDTVQGLGISTLLSGFGTLANKGLRSLRDYMILPYTNIETMNFAPTREQLLKYPAESRFNLPEKTLTTSEAENVLRNRAQNSGVEIGGNIDHYLNKMGRQQYVRTLSNTLENPDITYSLGNKNYFVKKYNGVQGKEVKPFNDFIVKKDGKLYTKFVPDDLDYVSNQLIKNNPQDLSLRGVTNSTEPTGGKVGTSFYKEDIPYYDIVVNSKLPHVSSLSEGLNGVQKQQFGDSFRDVMRNNSQKLGTLGSMYQLRDNLVNKPYLSSVADKLSEAILTAEQKVNMPKWTRLLQTMPNKFNNQYPYFANTLSWMGSREY